MSDAPKAVVVFSGGLDSTTLLCHARAEGYDPLALSFNYGQRHAVELEHAADVARVLEVPHMVVDLGPGVNVLMAAGSQTGGEPVPEGHYAEETMRSTIVPNRNMVLLSLATAFAVRTKAAAVFYGAHQGDHAVYPDCRVDFVEALARAVSLCDWNAPSLLAPFVALSKADVVALADRLGAPLGLTWSCYKGGVTHCGKCGTCVERKEAFQLAGVSDPTCYEA